jgi:hypothetical protein
MEGFWGRVGWGKFQDHGVPSLYPSTDTRPLAHDGDSLAVSASLLVCEHSFSGAFHCPPAVEFCRFETVSGVRYPEFVPWQLYLLLVLFPGLPIAVTLFCLFPCRDVCVMPAKRW